MSTRNMNHRPFVPEYIQISQKPDSHCSEESLEHLNNYIPTIEIKRERQDSPPQEEEVYTDGPEIQIDQELQPEQSNQEGPSLTLSQFLQREEFKGRTTEFDEKENEPILPVEHILESPNKNTHVIEKPLENSQMKIEFVKYANIGFSKQIIKPSSIFESEQKRTAGLQEFIKPPMADIERRDSDGLSAQPKNDPTDKTPVDNGLNRIIEEAKVMTLSQYSIATPQINDPENSEPTYAIQNLKKFLQETVKKSQENSIEKNPVIAESSIKRNSYAIFDDRDNKPIKSLPHKPLSCFADKRKEKDSQSVSKFNRAQLNALPNNSLQLKTMLVSKEAEIRYLKEKLNLAKEAKSIQNQMMRTEDRSKINQFKSDQLQVQIKSLAKENQEYQKQIDFLKKKSQKDTEDYQKKLYFFQMEFESQTRFQMETKERDIVVEYLDREDPDLRSLLDRMIYLEDMEKNLHK